jgi:hypothetical protein
MHAPGLTASIVLEHARRGIMEHRWGHRFTVSIPVRITLSSGVVVWGRVHDLSISGAYIESIYPLPVSALVTVDPVGGRFNWPATALAASVIRSESGGVGIEWCEPWEAVPEGLAQEQHWWPQYPIPERPLHAA